MSTALFLGRFQPLPHKGHVQVIEEILTQHERIIIGLGSSQYNGTYDNLLTIEERTIVFEALFQELGIDQARYSIVAIPDIHDNEAYADHVKNVVGAFDTVYTGNDLVQHLFKEKGYTVISLIRYDNYEGKIMREKIKAGDMAYKDMIPEMLHRYLDEWNIEERLQAEGFKV